MILSRVLKSLLWMGLISCTSVWSEKAGIESEPSNSNEEMSLFLGGSIKGSLADSCFRSINEVRRVKLVKGNLIGSDYQMQVEKRSPGYLIRLEKDGRVIQLARALKEYEIPLATAALARDHIPDGVNRSAAIQDRF